MLLRLGAARRFDIRSIALPEAPHWSPQPGQKPSQLFLDWMSAGCAAAVLAPPQYTGACSALVGGLNRGDALLANVPLKDVVAMGHGKAPRLLDKLMRDTGEPPWADYSASRVGQSLWRANLGAAFVSLMAALMLGFSIARFAVVLVASGYTSSTDATWFRFRETGFAIMDWISFPLAPPKAGEEESSWARRSIYRVRCLHELARRRALEKGTMHGAGVALSQYDMAIVLLAFSGICISIMECEVGAPALQGEERAAMVATWRLIGWHLGIEDCFNACRSCAVLDATCADFMASVPARFESVGAETLELQVAVARAFGAKLPVGVQWFLGWTDALLRSPYRPEWHAHTPSPRETRGLFTDAEPALAPLFGVSRAAWCCMRCIGPRRRSRLVGQHLLAMRELHRTDPARAKRFEAKTLCLSRLFDCCVWPTVSALCRVAHCVRSCLTCACAHRRSKLLPARDASM